MADRCYALKAGRFGTFGFLKRFVFKLGFWDCWAEMLLDEKPAENDAEAEPTAAVPKSYTRLQTSDAVLAKTSDNGLTEHNVICYITGPHNWRGAALLDRDGTIVVTGLFGKGKQCLLHPPYLGEDASCEHEMPGETRLNDLIGGDDVTSKKLKRLSGEHYGLREGHKKKDKLPVRADKVIPPQPSQPP